MDSFFKNNILIYFLVVEFQSFPKGQVTLYMVKWGGGSKSKMAASVPEFGQFETRSIIITLITKRFASTKTDINGAINNNVTVNHVHCLCYRRTCPPDPQARYQNEWYSVSDYPTERPRILSKRKPKFLAWTNKSNQSSIFRTVSPDLKNDIIFSRQYGQGWQDFSNTKKFIRFFIKFKQISPFEYLTVSNKKKLFPKLIRVLSNFLLSLFLSLLKTLHCHRIFLVMFP